ncbi:MULTISPECIES: hypothetical protein [Pseudomonas]|uniref:TnsA endonuclease N-terminal domain-containing protein n=2 Tax=Pseudomonas TaxID=286 RepID=B1J7K7_PSEPW|nr:MULTISPECIES: hypothetical protein [Pseudomonas]MBP2082877.1 hypothetical protein [Pseudomonas sp. PvP089]MBP2091420.1 hypothetical protein [Pseudomonas sp. PvP088]MBP2222417.1 hypothetical protein [Pseudomonas putida]MDZ4021572.1 hypothetical protein [Pseudomonas sichuanensis]PMY77561.1 hypothetical protein C1X72_30160 [Pseudomonas sp. FW306-2-2C-D06B]
MFTYPFSMLPNGVSVTQPPSWKSILSTPRLAHFRSMKNGLIMSCNPRHASFCIRLECDWRINAYTNRPFAFHFTDQHYTVYPTYVACLTDGTCLHYQLTTREQRYDPEIRSLLRQCRVCFADVGLTLKQVDVGLDCPSLRRLYHEATLGSASQIPAIQQLLKEQPHGRATLDYLLHQGMQKYDVAYGLFHHFLAADLTRPLTAETEIATAKAMPPHLPTGSPASDAPLLSSAA